MASTELVGPLPTVVFHGGYELRGNVAYKDPGVRVVVDEPPAANTLDPRYPTCTNHRTACPCREAILNEDIAEYRAWLQEARKAAAEVLSGHNRYRCSCTGCRLARKAHLW